MSRPCSATARPWRSDQIRGGAVQSGQRGPAPELCKKALADYAAAKRENPSFPYLDRYITHTRAQACDWSRPDAEKGLIDGVRRGERTCEPFRLLSLSDNESDHLTCAKSWVADKFSRGAEAPRPTSKNDGLIRVANLSSDFRPERLIFAPRVGGDEHLARHKLAGLFIDTLPYNAHTTANDAMRAGVPLVTCVGSSFAGPAAQSLLPAVAGCPELIAQSTTTRRWPSGSPRTRSAGTPAQHAGRQLCHTRAL